jgi:hypothetical protein
MSVKALIRVFVTAFVVGMMWMSTPVMAKKAGGECAALKSKATCTKNAACSWNKKCVAKAGTAAKKGTAAKAKPAAKKKAPEPAVDDLEDPMLDDEAEGDEDF